MSSAAVSALPDSSSESINDLDVAFDVELSDQVVENLEALEDDTADSTPRFADLELPAALLRAGADLGFEIPTAIQAAAIPALLAGRDITGVAQTGTGKTAAFGMPLLASITSRRGVQALVLTPTRELAVQVAEAIASFAQHMPSISVVPIYGGSSFLPQRAALKAGAQIVVGTPGRIIDHLGIQMYQSPVAAIAELAGHDSRISDPDGHYRPEIRRHVRWKSRAHS